MPQFNPMFWINIISWLFILFIFLLWYNQSINLPKTLKLLYIRTYLLFNNL